MARKKTNPRIGGDFDDALSPTHQPLLTLALPHVTVTSMESKLAEYAEQQLIEAAKRMTREQRLRAFIEHSKRMVQLQRAGKIVRDDPAARSKSSATPSKT